MPCQIPDDLLKLPLTNAFGQSSKRVSKLQRLIDRLIEKKNKINRNRHQGRGKI